jgi:predicted nucleic acid-binding protein
MKFSLDSSVIAKLFINEKGSDDAIETIEKCQLKNIELLASVLIIYEVGNIILKNIKNKKYNGTLFIKQLFLLNIEYINTDQKFACKVMELAQKYNITYYDAVHIGISEEFKSPLITEDKELLKKYKNAINIKKALRIIKSMRT